MVLTYEQLSTHLEAVLSGCFSFDPFIYDYLKNLKNTGCRAMEMFDLNRWSIFDNENLQLIPQKGNLPRIILKNLLSEGFNEAVINKPLSYYSFSYSQANFYFKRFSIYSFVYHDSRPETLNLFRHYVCKTMKLQGYSDQLISEYFGEIDITNIRNYIYSDLVV